MTENFRSTPPEKSTPDETAQLMAKAIEINPRLTTPYLNIGLALQALNRLDEALVRYEAVIALKPDYAEV